MKSSVAVLSGLLLCFYAATASAQSYAMGSLTAAYAESTTVLKVLTILPPPAVVATAPDTVVTNGMKRSLDLLPNSNSAATYLPKIHTEADNTVQTRSMAEELENWLVTEQALRKTYSRRRLSIF